MEVPFPFRLYNTTDEEKKQFILHIHYERRYLTIHSQMLLSTWEKFIRFAECVDAVQNFNDRIRLVQQNSPWNICKGTTRISQLVENRSQITISRSQRNTAILNELITIQIQPEIYIRFVIFAVRIALRILGTVANWAFKLDRNNTRGEFGPAIFYPVSRCALHFSPEFSRDGCIWFYLLPVFPQCYRGKK